MSAFIPPSIYPSAPSSLHPSIIYIIDKDAIFFGLIYCHSDAVEPEQRTKDLLCGRADECELSSVPKTSTTRTNQANEEHRKAFTQRGH